jgi:hypothetical protein
VIIDDLDDLVIDDLGSSRLSILTGRVGIGGSMVWLRQGRDGVKQQAKHSFPLATSPHEPSPPPSCSKEPRFRFVPGERYGPLTSCSYPRVATLPISSPTTKSYTDGASPRPITVFRTQAY